MKRLIAKLRQRLRGQPAEPTPASSEPGSPPVKQRRHKPSKPRRTERPHRHQPAAGPEPSSWRPEDFSVEPAEGRVRFHDLHLPDEVLHAIADLNFRYCTPIQAAILPKTLAGADAAGRAQTGTGKTAAFLITILTHLLRRPLEQRRYGAPRALILAPTRELVMQIANDATALAHYSHARIVAVFGGMDFQHQKNLLADAPVDIVAATPGRLLDFQRRGVLDLRRVEILVIDEADRMLDMGFIPDVRRIVQSTPPKSQRQTLFFSATLTPDVLRLAEQWTRNPVMIEIEPEQVAVKSVDQVVYIVTAREKFPLLYHLITRQNLQRVLVFGNRRDETADLTDRLRAHGIQCALISGDVPQEKRIRTLEAFRAGQLRVLVATDVAARGLHVEGISHVINYHLPMDPEDYVHRIGRTGRAGATGTSISFACEEDSFHIPAIEEYLGHTFACIHPEDEWLQPPPSPAGDAAGTKRRGRRPSTSSRRPRRRT